MSASVKVGRWDGRRKLVLGMTRSDGTGLRGLVTKGTEVSEQLSHRGPEKLAESESTVMSLTQFLVSITRCDMHRNLNE